MMIRLERQCAMKTGAKLCITLIIVFLIVAVSFPLASNFLRGEGKAAVGVESTPGPADAPFWLGLYDGKLASFEKGKSIPLQIFDLSPDMLPEYDRELLKKGIPAESRDALDELIENYTS